MKSQTVQTVSFKTKPLTQSINSKIIVLECKNSEHQTINQSFIISIVHVLGQWPDSPCIIQRKNYPKMREFVCFNKQGQNPKGFLHEFLNKFNHFLKTQNQHRFQLQNHNLTPSEIMVSNSGKRLSFWLDDEVFQELCKIQAVASLFEQFQWIKVQENKYQNEVEYGSQTFINLIEMMSLQSMAKLLSLKEYVDYEFKDIQSSLHAVTSLVNYNYRYFYPPKDATRFLKKTSGVTIVSNSKTQEKRSNRWAEEVFLRSLFELRPTQCLCKILSSPEGPIYLEKYGFSMRFYEEIESVYFMGSIKSLFRQNNLRNYLEYVLYMSRVFPGYLMTIEGQKSLQRLRSQGFLKIKNQNLQLENDDQDSQSGSDKEDRSNSTKVSGLSKQEKEILELYQKSSYSLLQKVQKQLIKTIKYHKSNPSKNDLDQIQLYLNSKKHEIDQFSKGCSGGSITFCLACGFSNSRITTQQKQLDELFSFFKYGNQTYCISCGDLNIKDKLMSQKQRIKEEMTKPEIQMEKQQQPVETKIEKQQTMEKKATQKLSQQAQNPDNNSTQKTQKLANEQQRSTDEKIPQPKSEALKQEQMMQAQQSMSKKAQQQSKKNDQKSEVQPRQLLVSERYILAWYLMMLRLKNQSNEFVSADYFYDCLHLSKLAGQLTSPQYIDNQLQSIYEFYQMCMRSYFIKSSSEKQPEYNRITSQSHHIKQIKQRTFMKVSQNVVSNIIKKSIISSKSNNFMFSTQKEQQHLIPKLYTQLDQFRQIYALKIDGHYREYKQVMNRQYKVTQFQLKEMITSFQTQLKNKIVKSTQYFLFQVNFMIIFVLEYANAKFVQIKSQNISVEYDNQISFFLNQIQFCLNLLAILVNNFNQPGQAKIIQSFEKDVTNAVLILIQAEKQLRQKITKNNQFDPQVVQILLIDMLQHFIDKRGQNVKQQAKKLTSKHAEKLKPVFQSKIKSIHLKKIFNFENELDQLIFTIAEESIKTFSGKQIQKTQFSPKNGHFSSLFFLEKHFEKQQNNPQTNSYIMTFMSLIALAANKIFNNDSFVLKSKSQPTHQIKMSVIYKLIFESVQKPQSMAQLLTVIKSGNTILIDLINQLITQSFRIDSYSKNNEQLAKRLKLYIERVRYIYKKGSAKKNRAQITEIMDFLFNNRNLLFNVQNQTAFENQYHILVQVIILNAFPLFNIQLSYKSQLKQIGKTLKHFDVNDNYNQIEDYYLKVLNFRHNKSKEKRKKELQSKKGTESKQ